MAPSVVNDLFEHIAAKVDVDVLKAKIREQENILSEQAKDTK